MFPEHALTLGLAWLASAIAMTAVWWVQKRTSNAGYVDVAWAACLAFCALFYGTAGGGSLGSRLLIALLASLWGFRLCLHLLARVLHEDEDGRYRALREHWGGNQFRFFLFFQAQALLVVLFSIPFLVVAQNEAPQTSLWTLAAVAVWSLSLFGETLADRQLATFRADAGNRGKVCAVGLWGWSRHPNYFFEWLHWFAYVLLAVGCSSWYWSLIGPVLMLVSLLWVSGIPWTEMQALRSRGEAYREYQRSTSAFFPWPPRARPARNQA
jgi:steroid 5-alpha reductase family enzyme